MNYSAIKLHSVKNIETFYNEYDTLLKVSILQAIKSLVPFSIITKNNFIKFKLLPEYLKFKLSKLNDSTINAVEEKTPKIQVIVPLKIIFKTLNKYILIYCPLIELPYTDLQGNFILNGMKRGLVSKMVRQNGVYFNLRRKYGEDIYSAQLILNERSKYFIELFKEGIFIYNKFNKKINLINFLHFIGLNNSTISSISRYGTTEIFKNFYYFNSKEDIQELEKIKTLLNMLNPELNLKYLKNKLNFSRHLTSLKNSLISRTGNFLESSFAILGQDLISILDFLLDLKFKKRTLNDLDHFGNRKVESLGHLISAHLEYILPNKLFKILNLLFKSKFITSSLLIENLKESFNKNKISIKELLTVNPLIQYLEEVNSVSELMHKVRISSIGPGSLTQNQAGVAVREVRPSQLGKICILDTNEGPSSGLVVALASNARINKEGSIETLIHPNKKLRSYSKFLNSFEQESFLVSFENLIPRKQSFLNKYSTSITFEKGEIKSKTNISDTYYKINPSQLLSYTENLIPFLFYNDPTRCLMGARMQTQAVPLIYRNKPYILTGFESIIASKTSNLLRAYQEGVITKVTSYKIVLIDLFNREITYYLQKYKKTNQGTFIHQLPIVWPGERVLSGQLLTENQDISDSEFNIGNNLNVLYGSYYGYEYEDSLIISQKVLYKNIFTSIHFDIYEIKYSKYPIDTPEYSTLDLPKRTSYQKRHLDKLGIITEGSKVLDGDILISKISVSNLTLEDSPFSELIFSLFGTKLRQLQDKSISVPIGNSGRVIKTELFAVTNKATSTYGQNYLTLRVFVAKQRMLQIGDKLCGRHGNKGVISNIAEEAELPYNVMSQYPDIITGPLGVPSRMNLGQLFESLFGYNCVLKDKRLLINSLLNNNLNNNYTKTYLYTSLQSLKYYTGNKSLLNPYIPGKLLLRDGRTGYRLKGGAFMGTLYYSKLIHMVKDKVHYRTFGPYTEITQQPIKGRGKGGGQRFGEMEVWALEAFGASYTLRELLTSKSDDLISRNNLQEYLLNNTPLEPNYLPEALKLLIRELHGLSLNLEGFMVTDLLDGKLLPLNINY
uniref:DNA-directed RNA polymerase subunit beta n=1 Tax=Apicomplexa sp. corallicolid ex Leiopathes glaberrima TaxID=2720216 RepID=A0A6M3R7J4_9APIC|nr:RNA polymerase subunit beta [Apicomplexa sp. corallicolid ex Leiopathes glaberrima]